MTGRRHVLTTVMVLMTLLAVGLAGLFGASPAAATTAHAAGVPARLVATANGSLPVKVSLQSISPAALTPDNYMTITGTLRNTGRAAFSDLHVVLRLDWRVLSDRRQLAEWAAQRPSDPVVGSKQVGLPLGRSLAPGETAVFSISLPGAGVRLPVTAEAFGPRGLTVEIEDGSAATSRRVGVVRTFAVWNPVQRDDRTRLAILVPVGQGRQPVDPLGKGVQVPQLWEPDGRVNRLLSATSDPAFSYALDPALVMAAARDQAPQAGRPRVMLTAGSMATGGAAPSGAGPTGTPPGTTPTGSTPGSGTTKPPAARFDPTVGVQARAVLTRLRGSLVGREVYVLPYADPDVAALGNGFARVLDVADDEAALVSAEMLGRALPGGFVWPAPGRIEEGTAGLAAGVPGRTLIIPSSAAAADTLGTMPVHARLTLPNGTAETLFTDDALTAALAATGGHDSAAATQRLLAETAAITAARPGRSTVVLATVPRDWNPDPAGVLSSLTTLRSAPWLRLEPLSTTRNQPAAGLERTRLTGPAIRPNGVLPPEHVRIVARQITRLRDFSPALATRRDQRLLLGPIRRSALELLATSWIARQKGVGPARGILTQETGGVYQGVTIVAGSSANLLARSGQLPITVDNHLPVPVHVVLHLHPTSGRVVVKTPIALELQAGRSQTVRAEIQAVANGEVRIESSLTTPGQEPVALGSTLPIAVRVNYDWETRGLFWVVGVLLLLLIAGLVRNVRKGRVRVSPDSVPDPDDVGREPVAGPGAGPVAEPVAGPAAERRSESGTDTRPTPSARVRGLFEPVVPPLPPTDPGLPGRSTPRSVTMGGLALAARTAASASAERRSSSVSVSPDASQTPSGTEATHADSPVGPDAARDE